MGCIFPGGLLLPGLDWHKVPSFHQGMYFEILPGVPLLTGCFPCPGEKFLLRFFRGSPPFWVCLVWEYSRSLYSFCVASSFLVGEDGLDKCSVALIPRLAVVCISSFGGLNLEGFAKGLIPFRSWLPTISFPPHMWGCIMKFCQGFPHSWMYFL